MQRAHTSRRRGVIILIVLCLLVLFGLIAVSFAIVAGNYLRSSRAAARLDQHGDPPSVLLDAGLYQVLTGNEMLNDTWSSEDYSTASAIRGHNLLRDLYGFNDSVTDTTKSGVVVGTQFLEVTCNANGRFSDKKGYYNGCVFTMTNGLLSGLSARVVDYTHSSPTCMFRIELMEADRAALVTDLSDPNAGKDAFDGKRFVVNGRPNNGAGFGYASGNLNDDSLLPNYSNIVIPSNGDTDEGYDVPDYRDMWLSYYPANYASHKDIVPSFHKPELVNYWIGRDSSKVAQACLRPLAAQNPDFSGSNPYLDPAVVTTTANMNLHLAGVLSGGGPDPDCRWDVDNDRDGLYESVWIDLGLPPKTGRDGRLYKPLFAILIRDLDGRLNVNAHGHVLQTTADYTGPASGMFAGGTPSPPNPRRGHGYGPAEINLADFLGSLGFNQTQVVNFVNARYGSDSLPGVAGAERIAMFRTQGMIGNYPTPTTALSGWGSPPDVWGRGAELLDPDGNAWHCFAGFTINGSPLVDERVNTPYELNLVQPTGNDTPYTYAELERLLRDRDGDSHSLSARLASIPEFGSNPNAPSNAAAITTASFDVPAPMAQPPAALRASLGASASIMEIFDARLTPPLGGVADPNTRKAQIDIMLPPELRRSQRFNVNRLFGNGRDDNNNGTVDEPAEGGEQVYGLLDGNAPQTGNFVNDAGRAVYARYLYCLAMALVDKNYEFPTVDTGVNTADKKKLKARRLAQWAVNCVDYRDPDNIMTPFEYDVDPFNNNGWAVDGDLSSTNDPDREVVWGMEFPDLLLSESLAFHDRRVKDADNETPNPGTDSATKRKAVSTDPKDDNDLDQYGPPQGSLFLELYCPHVRWQVDPSFQSDLYTITRDGSGNITAATLNLAKLSPSDGARQYPVWRVAVSASQVGGAQANSPQALVTSKPDSVTFQPESMDAVSNATAALDRYIWFTNQSPAGFPDADRIYYNRFNAAELEPGAYAYIGPRQTTVVGATDANALSNQKITIAQNYITVNNRGGGNANAAASGNVKLLGGDATKISALGIVAAAPVAGGGWAGNAAAALGTGLVEGIGISVSEPTRDLYYPVPTGTGGVVPTYATPHDIPFDTTGGTGNSPLKEDPSLQKTATYGNYRTAYLQRLANPLAAYNAQTNPYITVDWIPIDLTTFNGTDRKPSGWAGALPWDPGDPDPPAPRFNARERDGILSAPGGPSTCNLWAQSHLPPDPSTPPADATLEADNFPYSLGQTLGYLNSKYGPGLTTPAPYLGSPSRPFPWLGWANRPFNTPLELMLVPSCSQARLLQEFKLGNSADPYLAEPPATPATNTIAPFRHLLNFFQSKKPAGSTVPDYAGTPSPYDNDASELSRLFDFLETPSPFAGTERWFDPDPAKMGAAAGNFKPPFCNLSRYREPGRVNLNTIADKRVLGALAGVPAGAELDTLWNNFETSRRGYGTASMSMDAAYPSRFAHPFCSAAGADLAATPNMRYKGVDATLLRPTPGTAPQPPLFLGPVSTNDYDNSSRNPSLTYSRLTRLANLTTTRSNVFAVWITVGYFEYDPAARTLGREQGWDLGTTSRNRAFYMIDRSIPVAYAPGETNNVDRCVPVRRYLE